MATTETALASRESTALEVWTDTDWESDGTEEAAAIFPIVSIVQPMSQVQGARPGDFFNPDTGESLPYLDVVPLFQKETRAYFVEGNDTPQCISADGRRPLPNQPLWLEMNQPAPACSDCPFSQWGTDGKPPPCRNSIVVLADMAPMNGETTENRAVDLIQFRVKGTSIKPWRRFIGMKVAAKNRTRPLCSYRLHLTTVEKLAPARKWYELVIESEDLTPAKARRYNEVIRYERERFNQAAAQAAEANASDDEHGPAYEWPDERKHTPTPTPRPDLAERLGQIIDAQPVVKDDDWAFEEPTT